MDTRSPQQQAIAEQAAAEQQAAAKNLGLPVVVTNSIGMKLLLIPRGDFMMGTPADEKGRWPDESPQQQVRISKPFYLGCYEVTVGQFRQFVEAHQYQTEAERDGKGGMGWKGRRLRSGPTPEFSWQNIGIVQSDEYPVVNVTWNDAVAFCEWLSHKEARTYRLPTEAEWEYACRAKTATPLHFGESLGGEQANFDGLVPYGAVDRGLHLEQRTRVGSYRPNGFGLFDMHGNVYEWCQDWYDAEYYDRSPAEDPVGSVQGSLRVYRGGGWNSRGDYCRSGFRIRGEPEHRHISLGFRVAEVVADQVKAGQ